MFFRIKLTFCTLTILVSIVAQSLTAQEIPPEQGDYSGNFISGSGTDITPTALPFETAVGEASETLSSSIGLQENLFNDLILRQNNLINLLMPVIDKESMHYAALLAREAEFRQKLRASNGVFEGHLAPLFNYESIDFSELGKSLIEFVKEDDLLSGSMDQAVEEISEILKYEGDPQTLRTKDGGSKAIFIKTKNVADIFAMSDPIKFLNGRPVSENVTGFPTRLNISAPTYGKELKAGLYSEGYNPTIIATEESKFLQEYRKISAYLENSAWMIQNGNRMSEFREILEKSLGVKTLTHEELTTLISPKSNYGTPSSKDLPGFGNTAAKPLATLPQADNAIISNFLASIAKRRATSDRFKAESARSMYDTSVQLDRSRHTAAMLAQLRIENLTNLLIIAQVNESNNQDK